MFEDTGCEESPSSETQQPAIEALQAQVEQLQSHYEEEHDRYLRAAAELRNYRRRMVEQQAQQIQYAHEQLLTALVPVLDHFELALQSVQAPEQSRENLAIGLRMAYEQLINVLSQFGLKRVDTIGEQFDPQMHEAVERSAQETGEASEGQIIKEFRPGYKLHDRLVRPAEVCVCVKQQASEDGEQPTFG